MSNTDPVNQPSRSNQEYIMVNGVKRKNLAYVGRAHTIKCSNDATSHENIMNDFIDDNTSNMSISMNYKNMDDFTKEEISKVKSQQVYTMGGVELESAVVNTFVVGDTVNIYGKDYEIVLSCKPTSSKGEPKTDAFILLEDDDGEQKELKISVKSMLAEHWENKMSATRLNDAYKGLDKEKEELLDDLHEKCSKSIPYTISKSGKRTLSIGFRLDATNKFRKTGYNKPLPAQVEKEFISGEHNSDTSKIDSFVSYEDGEREIHTGSGVANYIFKPYDDSQISSAQSIVDNLVYIDDLVGTGKSHMNIVGEQEGDTSREESKSHMNIIAANTTTYVDSKGNIKEENRPMFMYYSYEATPDGKRLTYELKKTDGTPIPSKEVKKMWSPEAQALVERFQRGEDIEIVRK